MKPNFSTKVFETFLIIMAVITVMLMFSCKKENQVPYGIGTPPTAEKTISFTWDGHINYLYLVVIDKSGASWKNRTIFDGAPADDHIFIDSLEAGDSISFRAIPQDSTQLTIQPSFSDTVVEHYYSEFIRKILVN